MHALICANFLIEETLYQKVEEFGYVDYNHVRPHSFNGYRTPYETRTSAYLLISFLATSVTKMLDHYTACSFIPVGIFLFDINMLPPKQTVFLFLLPT